MTESLQDVFVGREHELDVLRAGLEAARAGHPRVVLIEGAAGIGKTALLDRFLAGAGDARTLRAQGEELEADLPLGVVDQMLRAAGEREPGLLGSAADHFAAGTRLLATLGALQGTGPVVLVLDDAHWADAASLRAVLFVLRRLVADAVLAVVAARDTEAQALPEGLRRLAAGSVLTLPALAVAELRELAGCRLPARAARRLHAHTRGNPLYAKALLEELPAGAWHEAELRLPAPRAFAGFVVRRAGACGEPAQRLLEAVAVLGSRCTLADAARLAGLQEPFAPLEEACEAGLLHVTEDAHERTVSFLHPLMRVAIRDRLGVARRADLHTAAAALSIDEATELRHLLAAAPGPDAGLAARLDALAEQRAAAGHWSSAAADLLAASRASASPAEREQRMLRAVDALLSAGDFASARTFATRLESLSPGPRRDGALGFLAVVGSRPQDAEPLLDRAWASCDASDEPALAASIAQRSALHWLLRLDEGRVLEWSGRAIELIPPADPTHARARALHAQAHAKLGRFAVAHATLAPVLALEGDLGRMLTAHRGRLRLFEDDLGGARADLEPAVRAAVRLGALDTAAFAATTLVEAEYAAGAWENALAHAEQTLAIVQELDHAVVAFVWSALVKVPAARGEWAVAEAYAKTAAATATDTGDRIANVALTQALLYRARGEPSRVLAALEPLTRLQPRDGLDEPGLWGWHDLYADALVDTGRPLDAGAFLAPHEALAGERGRASALARLARVRGRVEAAAGRRPAAESAFRTALEYVAPLGMPYERAQIELAHGSVLRRFGRRRDAVTQLSAAKEALTALRALPALERCERELAACGLHPAKRSTLGEPSLTPQERSVAQLAALGKTNRAIAAELLLSAKTIEFHLTNIYAKLGVSSRAHLGARLGEVPGART